MNKIKVFNRPALSFTMASFVLLALTIIACFISLISGTFSVSFENFTSGDSATLMVLYDLRLPRILAALLSGACLAASGWIFQRMSRNSLASPDIIGLTTGAATGGLVVLLLLGHGGSASAGFIASGTLLGSLFTILSVYLICYKKGIGGQWLILAGISVAALLAAVNDYLITRADIDDAVNAKTWLFGSLQAVDMVQILIMAVIGLPLLILSFFLSRHIDILEMGDDLANSLGLKVKSYRISLLLIAVCLTSLVIATAGPIGFVALVSPQLAKRICGGKNDFLSVILVGALLCILSDLFARIILAPFQIPMGLITSLLGGGYLAWILARQWRE